MINPSPESVEARLFEQEMIDEYQEAAERSNNLSSAEAELILEKAKIISYNQIPVGSRENIFRAVIELDRLKYLAIVKEYKVEELMEPEIDAPHYPRERAAYLFAQAVGFDNLIIPTITRIIDNQPRPFSIWKTSPVVGRFSRSYDRLRDILQTRCDQHQLWQLMIVNYSTGNTDGHDHNLKVGVDRQLWSFDYSLAFSKYRQYNLHPYDPIAVLDALDKPISVNLHQQLTEFARSPKYWELNYQLDELLPQNDLNLFRERFLTVVTYGKLSSSLVNDESAKFNRERFQKEAKND